MLNEFNLQAEQPGAATTTTLMELFEAQVERTPEAMALSFGQQRLSYAELNGQANRVAHYLMAKGIGRESLVGIALERSPEMVVAIVGVLKTGAAYVPLDPEYPKARLEHMLADARPAVVITSMKLGEELRLNTEIEFVRWTRRKMQSELGQVGDNNPGREQLPRGCGLCDLYLGIDGRAQGSGGDAGERDASVCGDGEDGSISARKMYGRCFIRMRLIFRCGRCGERCCTADGWWWCRRRSRGRQGSFCSCWWKRV